MALPNLGNKAYQAYTAGIGNIRDSLLDRISPKTFKGKVTGAIGGAFESEFPGILGVLAGFRNGVSDTPLSPARNHTPSNDNRLNLTPVTTLLLSIKEDTGQVPDLLRMLIKHIDSVFVELQVLSDLALRDSNLNKGNLMMIRSAFKYRANEYRDNEFEEQIAASKFTRVEPKLDEKTKPVEPEKKEDEGLLGRLKSFMGTIFTPFKSFFGILAPIAAGLAPILKLVARIGLVDIPVLGILAVGAKGLFSGIKKWYNGHQNGDRGLKGFENFTTGISETFDEMTKPVKDALAAYMKDHKEFFLPLIHFFSDVFSIMLEPFKAVYRMFGEEDLMTILKDSWENLKVNLVNALNILGALGDGWLKENITEPAAKAISGLLIGTKDKIVEVMGMIVDSVVNLFTEIKDTIKNYVTETYQNIKDSVKSTATNLVPERVREFFGEKEPGPIAQPKSGLQQTLEPNSKEAKTAAKMILNQQYVSNYNYAKDTAQVAASNIIAPVSTTNVKTNNFVASTSSVRNPNAQSIVIGNVAQ